MAEGSSRHFTGHERDTDPAGGNKDIDYMHARLYTASMGRLLSVDRGGDSDMHQPQSWDMYSYVRNNPATNRDPDGKICIPCLEALIGGTVGLVAESYRQTRKVIVHASLPTTKNWQPRSHLGPPLAQSALHAADVDWS